MRRISFAFLLFLLVVIYNTTDYTRLEKRTNIDEVRDLYKKVNQTLPSQINTAANIKIIQARLECYSKNNDYTARMRVCNNMYTKALVQQAREMIQSRPDIGRFVKYINLCPIMYNLCFGKTDNNQPRCIEFERQCIDYTLDVYWRGAAQYSSQQYRPE